MQTGSGHVALLIKETSALISLPEVCLKLRQVLADPDHSRKQVANTIMHDPALTARLLRIVNSAYYSFAAPVRDISQALGIIGEQELNNLAIVTAIVKNMSALNPEFDLRGFWKTSIFAATLARNLKPWDSKANKEELFLAGLLLDIGKLLMYMKEPALCRRVQQEMAASGREDFVVERELLGYDHSEVSAALLQAWGMSAQLQHCVGCHHRPPGTCSQADAATLLQLVGRCAGKMDFSTGTHQQDEDPFVFLSELEGLPLPSQELVEVLTLSLEGSRETYEVFCGNS